MPTFAVRTFRKQMFLGALCYGVGNPKYDRRPWVKRTKYRYRTAQAVKRCLVRTKTP
jgi:hypothetical protein